jgi:hypothetical protein
LPGWFWPQCFTIWHLPVICIYITGQRTGTGLKNHHPRLVCSLDLYFVGLAYRDKNILCSDSL